MTQQVEKQESKAVRGVKVCELRGVSKKFNSNLVLDDVSLSVEEGKTTVVIGPSGCGKTVLIKHLIGLLRPTKGEVYYRGTRIDEMSEDELNGIRTHFGFLFQEGALFDSFTVGENVLFPVRYHYEVEGSEKLADLVRMKLGLVGLSGYEDYFPANLSGGQRKRVALARAIALNPEVVLYDEPTTGLDPIRSDVINELILKLQKGLGLTSVVVTHDMRSAYKIADRIVMLHKGKIVADGSAEDIRQSSHPEVRNFINGQVSDEDLDVIRRSGNFKNDIFGSGKK